MFTAAARFSDSSALLPAMVKVLAPSAIELFARHTMRFTAEEIAVALFLKPVDGTLRAPHIEAGDARMALRQVI